MPRTKQQKVRRQEWKVDAQVIVKTDRIGKCPVLDISVYRTDQDHPHSLMFQFYYDAETRRREEIFVALYSPISAVLKRMWDATFGKLKRRK